MSTEKLKYVTKRRNQKGARWYWQRKGFPLVRLPDDPVKRFAQAHKLNEQAERAATIETADEGTIGWLIERYRESDRFQDKAPETQRIYERWLKKAFELLALGYSIAKASTAIAREDLGEDAPKDLVKKRARSIRARLTETAKRKGMRLSDYRKRNLHKN